MKPAPFTVADTIPKVCTVADVCRALNISQRRFYELRSAHTFPIPEIRPRLTRGPRFSGVDVQLYIEGAFGSTSERRVSRQVR